MSRRPGEPLAPRNGAAPAGRKPGRSRPMMHDRQHVHRSGEQAGNDAGDEQLADVLLGDDAVDREHRRRRQHGAERAAGGDHAGGERLRIVVAAHLRIGDGREGRGGRDRRAGDRGKAGAGGDGGDAEPAARNDRRNALAARNNSRLMPELDTNAPISRNIGMTPKV